MKTATDHLAELNARLKDMPAPDRVRIPDDGTRLEAGQLWTPVEISQDRADTPDQKNELPSWLYLLIEPLPDGLFNAVPVFRWTELADEDNLLLPASLTGLRLVASLSLESTIDRTMLNQCQGRYPDPVIEYIRSARMVADDPVARNQYRWGAPLLGPNDHRIAFHNAISDAIEAAQASVREAIYSEAITTAADSETGEAIFDNIIDFPSVFLPYEYPKAAKTGDRFTPTVILKGGPVRKSVVKESSNTFYHARSLQFDALIPDNPSPICCEWFIEDEHIPENAPVQIYDCQTHKIVGTANIKRYDHGSLITLTSHNLTADDPSVKDPCLLRIVIREPAP